MPPSAINAGQAEAKMEEFAEKWGSKYPAAVRLWRNAWAEFIPFMDYDVEIRKIHEGDRRPGASATAELCGLGGTSPTSRPL